MRKLLRSASGLLHESANLQAEFPPFPDKQLSWNISQKQRTELGKCIVQQSS